MSLGQMNAYDRRIAHIALKDNPDVQTRSRGEGPLRKLVIFPKKKNLSKR
jgi:spoIIIJ-associated protein